MKKMKINFDILKIIISLLLFVASLFLKDYFYLELTLLILSYVLVSYEVYLEAIKNLFKGEIFDENFLMIIATIGAFCIKEYTEAVMVMLLFEFGEYLSDLAVDNSKQSITKLLDLRSDLINLKIGEEIKTVPTKEAKLNDLFIVRPGEKIPLDGIVINGKSNIDTANLTGESLPRQVKEKDLVLSGTINLSSVLVIKATSEYTTSTSAKIIELIENSEDKKSNMEKFITKFAKIYTPIVVLIALIVAIIPTLVFKQEFSLWLYKSLQLLVISCPCALVISVPLASFCALGRASKEGILIKGSNELDNLNKVKALLVDKTGTITKGNFALSEIVSTSDYSKDKLLEIASYSEYYSNHPIAKSIIEKYSKKIDKKRIKDFKEISGSGIECYLDEKKVIIGNYDYVSKSKLKIEKVNKIGTVIYLIYNNEYLGYFLINDLIKEEARDFVSNLKNLDIEKVVMLSGDNEEIVSDVAKTINVDEYYGNLLPLDKVEKVKEIKSNYYCAFLGDGINDAPVIKLADVGIAMGGIGSDATIEASDIVLMNDNLNSLIKALLIAKTSRKLIVFNISFAIIIKVLMMLLAILGITSIWLAVFADVGVTLLLVLNSLTLMKRKIKK